MNPNHDWRCRICGAIGRGEETIDENGDWVIWCKCGHCELLKEKEDIK